MKNQFLCFCFFLPALYATAQAPAIDWQKTLGGNGNDGLQYAQQTPDGGYFLAGSSSSGISGNKTVDTNGSTDFWILQLDALGNIQWQKSIGGSSGDSFAAAQMTPDGGFILGGSSGSGISGDKTVASFGALDFWIVKIDGTGTIQWQKAFGGSAYEKLYDLQLTSDGGYILGGFSGSDISGNKTEMSQGGWDYWVVKLDASGDIQWQNTLGGSEYEELTSIQQTADGGYILGGYSDSNISGDKWQNCIGHNDYWVIKLDTTGNVVWQKTIGGTEADFIEYAQQTMDGGYILGGWTYSGISGNKTEASNGGTDCWVVKLDTAGNIQWQNAIGGSANDFLFTFEQVSGGDYVLTGWSSSNISGDKTENSHGGGDYWILKLDGTGNIKWQKSIGGAYDEGLFSSSSTNDGGLVLSGYSDSNISGDKTENCYGDYDYWIVKLLPESGVKTTEPLPDLGLQLSPNPFGDVLNLSLNEQPEHILTLRIFDLNGKMIKAYEWPLGALNLEIPTDDWHPGLYFVQARNEAGEVIFCEKAVKIY